MCDEDERDGSRWYDPKKYECVPNIKYLVHWVPNEKVMRAVEAEGLKADEYGWVYLSEKPIRTESGHVFVVGIPDIGKLFDWRKIWCDDDGYEFDSDHEYDKNNPYYIYSGDIPKEYVKVLKKEEKKLEKNGKELKVRYKEFYCEARLIDGIHKMRVKVTPNLGDASLVYDLKDFEKYFTYADGRKIEANSLNECMTMHCKRIPGQIIMARYEDESWFIDTIGTDYRLANKSFAVCFEPYKKDGDTEEEKEAKRLPMTENIKIAVYFITKSGEMIEPVNIRIQDGKIVYGVKGKDLIRKPLEEGYKTVGTLTRGIKKAIEELVWDGSNHVVGFKIRDYEAVRDYKLEV